jgi:hypothetical protein
MVDLGTANRAMAINQLVDTPPMINSGIAALGRLCRGEEARVVCLKKGPF